MSHALRPGVEIVDVVADVATVPPETWSRPAGPHGLQLAGAEPEVEGGLLGREERAPLLGPCRPGDIVVPEILVAASCVSLPACAVMSDGFRWAGRGSNIDRRKFEPLAEDQAGI